MAHDALKLAIWDLDPPPTEEIVAAGEVQLKVLDYGGGDKEKVIVTDNRTLVDLKHLAPKGAYRAIVKIFMKFEKSRDKYLGTGWLIENDIVVTAGHCLYDIGRNSLGRAIDVEVIAGYYGQQETEGAQKRRGRTVVVPQGWVRRSTNLHYDIGLVKLDSPFTDVTPLRYRPTPLYNAMVLGVIGYPADMSDNSGERGARMYEMFLPTYYDRRHSDKNVLIHIIASFGGNSGGPVIYQDSTGFVVIGVHVSGDVDEFANKATPLGPPNNLALPVGLYTEALKFAPQAIPAGLGIQMLPLDEVLNPDAAEHAVITNGKFENGTAASWSVQQLHANTRYDILYSSEGYDGWVFHVTGGLGISEDVVGDLSKAHSSVKLSQALKTKPGVRYDISVRHRYKHVFGQLDYARHTENTYLNIFVEGHYVISSRAIEGDPGASVEYMVELSGEFQATGQEALLEIYFTCTAWESQEYFLGGVKVTEKQE